MKWSGSYLELRPDLMSRWDIICPLTFHDLLAFSGLLFSSFANNVVTAPFEKSVYSSIHPSVIHSFSMGGVGGLTAVSQVLGTPPHSPCPQGASDGEGTSQARLGHRTEAMCWVQSSQSGGWEGGR